MNVLALDLGTKTGWALYENGRIESGVQDFSKKRGESNGMLFLHFNRWLGGMAINHARPDLIVYEQPHHRGGAATEIAVNLAGRVQEWCAMADVNHTSVHSMTLKKWATGSGRASKSDMIAKALRCGFEHLGEIIDDNHADALLLLKYALEEILGEKHGMSALRKPEAPHRPDNQAPVL